MFNQEQIKKIIPHRDPFLLIDEIVSLESSKKAVGIKYVKTDEYFFKGHFPEMPVMPGVLIVEALAQVGAVIVLSNPNYEGKIALFAAADNVRFRKQVIPGDKLELECEILILRGNYGSGYGKAYVDGELVCEGKLTFAIT